MLATRAASGRTPRSLIGCVIGAGLLVWTTSTAFAQLTITLGPYGPPPTAPSQAQPGAQNGPPSGYRGNPALAIAYAQYLQTLAAMNYAQTHPMTPEAAQQYMTNGAAATTIPSTGPGSAYFTNGAEATVVRPLPIPTAYAAAPSPAPSQSPTPYPWPFVAAPGSAAQAPPPVPAPTAVVPVPAPPAQPAEAQSPPVAMSWKDWLASMGVPEEAAESESSPSLTSAVVPTSVTEPAAAASTMIHRASFAAPEKLRKRIVETSGTGGIATAIMGAFAAGLLLGGLAMLRLRARKQSAESGEPQL